MSGRIGIGNSGADQTGSGATMGKDGTLTPITDWPGSKRVKVC